MAAVVPLALALAPLLAQSGDEYRVKAAFVSKLPQFAEWPRTVLAERPHVELCVARPNPFGDALDALVAGETLGGRPVVVRHVNDPGAIDSCQVLFIPPVDATERRALLTRAVGKPILTIGDSPGFLDDGGIVNLRVAGGRVRFDISVTAADRAGIRLSSQLLRLALTVAGDQQP